MFVWLLSFFHSDDKSRDKQEINKHERIRNKVFIQHIYCLTDDVLLQRNIWIIINQHEKFLSVWCSAVPAVTKWKQDCRI